MHFARLLRAAGLRIGPDRVVDCVQALEIAGPQRRDDWYWTMSAVLLSRQEQRPIFDQAFRIFWRDPKLAERMMSLMLPKAYGQAPKPEQQQSQRLTDALLQQPQDQQPRSERLELEARLTFSSREILSRMDFDTMSAAELVEAKKMLAELRLPLPLIRTRRFRAHPSGRRIDLRKTLRESLREGGDIIPLVRARQGDEPLDAVARFHLGNGAALERINWMGDISETGMARSAGLMVNYVYWLDEVERNHERYFREHAIAASPAIEKLARESLLASAAEKGAAA